MGKRLDIKSAPTGDDHWLIPSVNFGDCLQRCASKFRRIPFFAQRKRADQVMTSLCQRRSIRLCSKQIESLINLKCVRVHNFRTAAEGDLSRDLRFSRCSGPDDEENAFHSQ